MGKKNKGKNKQSNIVDNTGVKDDLVRQALNQVMHPSKGESLRSYAEKRLSMRLSNSFPSAPPQVSVTNVSLEKEKTGSSFLVKVEYHISYYGFSIQDSTTAKFSLNIPKEASVEGLVDSLTPVAKATIDKIIDNDIKIDQDGIVSSPSNLKIKQEINEVVEKEFCETLKEAIADKRTLINRLNQPRLPECPGFAQSKVTDITFGYIPASSGHIIVRPKLTIAGLNIDTEICNEDILSCLAYSDKTERSAKIKKSVNTLLQKIEEAVSKAGALYEIADFSHFAKPVYDLVVNGECVQDHLKMKYLDDCTGKKNVFRLGNSKKNEFYIADDYDVFKFNDYIIYNHDNWLKYESTPLSEFPRFQFDIAMCVRLCQSLAREIAVEAEKKNVAIPDIEVFIDSLGIHTVRFAIFDLVVPVADDPNSMAVWTKYYCGLAEYIVKLQTYLAEPELMLKDTISELNPTAYKILMYIAKKGSTTLEKMWQDIGKDLEFEKYNLDWIMEILSNLNLLKTQTEHEYIVTRIMGEEDGFPVVLYNCTTDPNRILNAGVKPREFTRYELQMLKGSAKQDWVLREMRRAKTQEERWQAFADGEEMVAKKTLTNFFNSTDGKEFLRGFTGDDALYVKLKLEDYPGCTAMVKEVFGA